MGALLDLVAGRIRRLAAARLRVAALQALAAGFALLALIVAGGILLARAFGPLWACLIVGAGALVVALILVLVAAAQNRAARRRDAADAAAQRQALLLLTAALPALRSRSTLLVAVAIGILAGLATSGPSGADDTDPPDPPPA